jgi:hypothetical protein
MGMYLAEVPADVEAIVALVRREAAEECAAGACPVAPVLDRCVRDAVAELADSRIQTFVPLLALRRVRDCIRAGSRGGGEW